MPASPRLRGGRTENYTVTYNNQVGPDTATQNDRTIPTYTGSVIYVDSTDGLDTNSGLTELLAVQTLSKAFELAQSGSKTYVVIINDEDVYLANGIELSSDKQLIAKDGVSPVVQFDKTLTTNEHTTSVDLVAAAREDKSTGDFFCGAASDGIYKRSSTDYTWSKMSTTATNNVTGLTLFEGRVYYCGGTTSIFRVDYDNTNHTTIDMSTYFSAVTEVAVYDGVVFVSGAYAGGVDQDQIFAIDSADNIIAYPVTLGDDINALYSDGEFCFFGLENGTLYQITKSLGEYQFVKKYEFVGEIYKQQITVSNGAVAVNTKLSVGVDETFINHDYAGNSANFVKTNISAVSGRMPFARTKNGISLYADKDENVYYSYDNGATWDSLSGGDYDTIGVLEYSSRGDVSMFGEGGLSARIDIIAVSSIYSVDNSFTVNGVSFNGVNFADYAVSGTDELISNWCKYYNGYGALRGGLDGTDKLVADNNIFYSVDYACSVADKDAIIDADNNIMYIKGVLAYSQFDESAPLVNLNHNTTLAAKLVKSEVGSFSLNGTTTNIKNNICWDVGGPFDVKTDIEANSAFDYNLFIAPSDYTQVNYSSGVFENNPLFNNENTPDLRLQSIAEGYKANSLYIKNGVGESSDSKDLGAYDVTRTLDSTTYSDDYTLIDPQYVATSIKVPGYGSALNTEGEYSEWTSNTTGYLRREFSLPYTSNNVNSNWYRQVQDIQHMYSQIANIYQFGYTNDGSTWASMRSGTNTVTGSTIAATFDGEEWGINKWAGYWILIDGTYYRILSSTAKTDSGTCTITVDGTPSTGAQAWSIDYILVQLKKGSAFVATPGVYMGAVDYNQSADQEGVVSSYTLKLSEVDSYDV